jgi:hypothetical protein
LPAFGRLILQLSFEPISRGRQAKALKFGFDPRRR